MKIILIINLFALLYGVNILNPYQVVEELKNITINDDILKAGIIISENLLKYYAFYITAQNPPQPKDRGEYFPKIDIDHLFDNVPTKNTNFYDFKNEFVKAVFSLNDIHIRPGFSQVNLEQLINLAPIVFYSKYNETTGETKMYGKPLPDNLISLYVYFRNGSKVYETITNNLNISIKSVKGQDPFDFIQNFLGIKLRNPHATYTYNSHNYLQHSFLFPVTLEDLINFEVVYENDESFDTDYIVFDYRTSTNGNKFSEGTEEDTGFINFLTEKDIIKEFENNFKQKQDNSFSPFYYKDILRSKTNLEWNYEYITGSNHVFACREDVENKVNVYKINNFAQVTDTDPSLEVIEQCAMLFDGNEFPVIIILPYNQGGNPLIGLHILEVTNPHASLRLAVRMRKFEGMGNFLDLYNYASPLFETHDPTKYGFGSYYFNDGFVTEKYGDKEQTISKPFYLSIRRDKINEIRNKLKYKRNANDIVIFTDSFSVSASSIFLKSFQKSGSGITVGFHGNPKINKDKFDASTSPSFLAGPQYYYLLNTKLILSEQSVGIGFQYMTSMQMHFDYQNSHDLMEYDITLVDERINFFNQYDDTEYDYFISEGKKILDKYKEKCNPDNQILTLYSDECSFSDSHLHGGHPCNQDGSWDKSKCIPVYCDQGYFFNRPTGRCLTYSDYLIPEEESTTNSNISKILALVFGILSIILIIIIIVLACLFKEAKKEVGKFIEKNTVMNTNDSENNLMESSETY